MARMDRRTVCLAVLVMGALALGGCSSLRTHFAKHPSSAMLPATNTASARYIRLQLDQHHDTSGFRLLVRSTNALMSRIALADHAQHSLDLQYYIFDNDATGRLVAQRLLVAADRGVRVRLLLDDINVKDGIDMLDALDAHPNIEVRLFNPFHTRKPSMLSRATQFLLDPRRLNHRMHNKSFIADSNVAIVGGRNIGDAYFDAGSDTKFRNLDLIAIGPVVKQASHAFDEYWNSEFAYPVTAFPSTHNRHYDLVRLRVDLASEARRFAGTDYAQSTLDELPYGATADRPGTWFWGPAMLVSDQPEKIEAGRDHPRLRIGPQIRTMTDRAQHEIVFISPYFIPGKRYTRYMTGLVARGVRVEVLTNSLASTDEPAVHSGYSRYRRALLEGGVKLYELQPASGKRRETAPGTSSGVSLHAKAIVVDRQLVFIGSMNMDERSKLLNTEMGIIVDSAPLAEAVTKFFDKATLPTNAYHVVLVGKGLPHAGSMQWRAIDNGKPMVYHHDPETRLGLRMEVMLLKLLPIEGLL